MTELLTVAGAMLGFAVLVGVARWLWSLGRTFESLDDWSHIQWEKKDEDGLDR